MSEQTFALVENSVSTDVGDETANRFRYQWVYSAILCCSLLDEKSGINEVFCEHHEDILLRCSDNSFVGIQVKTRANNQPLWRSSDEAVVKSLARFVCLNLQFPNQFKGFEFVSNHPLQATSNGQDVTYLLNAIAAQSNYTAATGVVKTFVKKIARIASTSEESVFKTLKAVRVNCDLPQMRDVTVRLMQTLTSVWEKANDVTFDRVHNAANHITNACFEAASLSSQGLLPAYFSISTIGLEQSICNRIRGKAFNKEKVETILLGALDEKLPLICGQNLFDDIVTANKELLRKKLSAGGFSAISTTYAEDLCDTSDYAGTRLVQKYGRELGLQRYNELKLKVQGDSARAFERVKKDEDSFGIQMLDSLRSELKGRGTTDEQLYGYTTEHLEGLAYSLTSQCKVVWSIKRPWEEK